MYNPCITIDVSQGKSHIQGFLNYNKKLSNPFIIYHNKSDFIKITELYNKIIDLTNLKPLIIFESTGIYHRTLQMFLEQNNLKYHIVAPLRAAKSRQNDLRSAKTDKRDCLSLSKLYYNNNLGLFKSSSQNDQDLKSLNRTYETILQRLQEFKVNFREILAVVYPNYKITKNNQLGVFKHVYSNESLGFLSLYPHPDLLLSSSKDDVITNLSTFVGKMHKNKLSSIIDNLFKYANSIIPGCSVTSPEVFTLSFYISQINILQEKLDEIETKLIALASNNDLFHLILSIPCVKENLASRLTAEIGDINKFTSYKALIAYAGTDPRIYQSGDNDGLHLKITKLGNKHVRTLLYLIVNQLIKAKNINSPIKDFYKKKTQQGLPKLAASIACCNKLIRMIYYMNKTGCAYFNQAH